jgi:hypothetical protein
LGPTSFGHEFEDNVIEGMSKLSATRKALVEPQRQNRYNGGDFNDEVASESTFSDDGLLVLLFTLVDIQECFRDN